MIAQLSFIFLILLQWFPQDTVMRKRSESFHPPLNIPLVLSANFGELRPNHFHMGLDFKTEGREGLTLHSIDEGYISRISISPYGYGRTVYINHPGGITSVYAHCQRLTGKVEKRVKELQMKAENSETDLYFHPNDLPMERGETFALSGNTGASRGAHLHFEIRDTYTEEALNPLLFGFKIADTKAPSVFNIKIYSLDEFGFMNEGKTLDWTIKNGTVGNGSVSIPSTFCSSEGGIGFALNATDKFDAAGNTCGIYGSRILVNGDTLMAQELNKFAFEDTRYLNGYTDYRAFIAGKKYHKSFHTAVNPLSVYLKKSLGILKIKPNASYQIQYDAFDYAGNTTITRFTLVVQDGEISMQPSKHYDPSFLTPMSAWKKEFDNALLEIPVGCTYEPIPKNIEKFGNSIVFKSDAWPVQEAFTIKMKARTDAPLEKQYLSVQNGGSSKALMTSYSNGWLEAKSKYFGEISVLVDEKPPGIVAKNVNSIVVKSKTKRLAWSMGDYQSGLANYGIRINGIWHVLDYESKGDFAFYELDDLDLGTYELVVKAIDLVGNMREETYTIELK